MISCRKILEALSDYLDDEMAAELRRDLEVHLAECKSCRVIYDTSRRTLRILTDVSSFEIPGDLSERLLRKTMEEIDTRRARAESGDALPEDDRRPDGS